MTFKRKKIPLLLIINNHIKMKFTLFILSITLSSFINAQTIYDNMLLYYNLDGDATDASGNGYDGVVNATPATDRFGNPNGAMYFNGVDSYINFPNMAALKPQLPVSFSFWAKYDSGSFMERVVFNTSLEEDVNSGVYLTSSSTTGQYAVGYGDGSPFYSSSSARVYISNSIVDTSQWNHIVVVVNGPTDMQIYVNCEENGGSYSGTGGTLAYSNEPGNIGRHDQNTQGVPAFLFRGKIDDFGYWDRGLTAVDASALCNDQYLTIDEESTENLINVTAFPNPFDETISLEVSPDVSIETIRITDATGMTQWESDYAPTLNVTGLAAGVYWLTAITADGTQMNPIKLVK